MKVEGRLPERARAPGAIRTRSQTTQGLLVTKEMILSKNELQSEAGLPSYKPERGQHASSTPGRGRVPGGNRRKDGHTQPEERGGSGPGLRRRTHLWGVRYLDPAGSARSVTRLLLGPSSVADWHRPHRPHLP